MKKLLLAATMFCALASGAHAVVIQDLGTNPRSAQGAFSNDVFGTTFEDQYTFLLDNTGPQYVTIASATNVFTAPVDFITNFAGQLFQQVGAIDPDGGIGDDIGFGLVAAVACPTDPSCQILAGTRLLNPGSYYLEITGTGGGQAGYGGNLTTSPVPIPAVGAGLPGLIAGFAAFAYWRKRRRQQQA